MKKIPLTRGKFALVDSDDYEKVTQYTWRCTVYGYAVAYMGGGRKAPKYQPMHRFLLDAPRGVQVDHINGNPLDNRRSNIRLCTAAQNSQNTRKRKGTSSRFKGVYWHKAASKWMAYINVGGRRIYLGLYLSETAAALAYDEAAKKHFKSFAKLNFPQEAA